LVSSPRLTAEKNVERWREDELVENKLSLGDLEVLSDSLLSRAVRRVMEDQRRVNTSRPGPPDDA
jgi:hypothetical protein